MRWSDFREILDKMDARNCPRLYTYSTCRLMPPPLGNVFSRLWDEWRLSHLLWIPGASPCGSLVDFWWKVEATNDVRIPLCGIGRGCVSLPSQKAVTAAFLALHDFVPATSTVMSCFYGYHHKSPWCHQDGVMDIELCLLNMHVVESNKNWPYRHYQSSVTKEWWKQKYHRYGLIQFFLTFQNWFHYASVK